MAATNVDIKRLFGCTISALQATQESSGSHNSENLPPVFGAVTKWIPPIQKLFETCKDHLNLAILDEGYFEDVSSTMEICKTKATRLDEIFYEVIRSSDAKERYQAIAKGDQLEDLMKIILRHAIQLSRSSTFTDVAGTQVEYLEEALRVFMAIPKSLPEDGPRYSFHNSGHGRMNVNTGTAPQNNNNSSGYQFNGPIHGFHLP